MEGLDIQKAVNLLAELLGEQEGYDIQIILKPKEDKILLLSHFSNLIIWYTIRKKEDII